MDGIPGAFTTQLPCAAAPSPNPIYFAGNPEGVVAAVPGQLLVDSTTNQVYQKVAGNLKLGWKPVPNQAI